MGTRRWRDCRRAGSAWRTAYLVLALALPGGVSLASEPSAGTPKAADKAGDTSAAPAEQAVPMEDVRVVAAPLGDPVSDTLTPVASQALTTEVIDREDLEWQKPVSAMDALNYTPSMQVTRKGRKNDYNLTLRGGEAVNVLVDGMNLSSLQDYRFVSYLPISLVEEIRVIRDSSSLIYGPPQLGGITTGNSYGYGGVVDFRLREPTDQTTGEVRTELGRYLSNQQGLLLTGPVTEDLGYTIGATRVDQNGPDDENLDREVQHLLARLTYRYLQDSTISFTTMYEDGWREMQRAHPPASVATQVQRWEYDPSETLLSTLQVHHAWSDDVSTDVGAYYRHLEATFIQHDIGLELDNRETKQGIFLRQAVRYPEVNTIRVGGELAEWRNPTGKLYFEGHPRDEMYYSLFAQDELEVIPDRLTLDAGVRWDRTYIDEGFTQTSAVSQTGVKPGGVEIRDFWRGPAVSYSAGARLEVTRNQTTTARYSVSTLSTDSSIVSSTCEPLPDSQERRAELGYQIRVHRTLTLGLVGFLSNIEDGTLYSGHKIIGGIDTAIYAANDFERTGLELSAEGNLGRGFSYFATGTWIKPRNETRDEFQNTMPRYMLAGGLGYQYEHWRAAIYAKNVPAYDDNAFTTGGLYAEIGDYCQVDTNVSYTFASAGGLEHEIYGGVRNLLNEHYETVVGYPDQGIFPYIGYVMRF